MNIKLMNIKLMNIKSMKTLSTFINESRYFKLNDDERLAIADLVGMLTGNIGETSDIKKYSEYWRALSTSEQEQMNDLYNVLDDTNNWPVINKNNIKDDVDLLVNFLEWVDENDLWGDYEYDGVKALEKISI